MKLERDGPRLWVVESIETGRKRWAIENIFNTRKEARVEEKELRWQYRNDPVRVRIRRYVPDTAAGYE